MVACGGSTQAVSARSSPPAKLPHVPARLLHDLDAFAVDVLDTVVAADVLRFGQA